jgi:protein O-GlcNAc transferase
MKIKRKIKKVPANIFDLAITYHKTGALEQAALLYRKILTQDPDNHEALHMLGVLCSQRGDYDSAIQFIQKTLDINPHNPGALYNLGNTFRRNGQIDEAIRSYQRSLQLDANRVDLHYNLGCVYTEKGQLDEAITSFQKALELNPRLFDALCNLGNIHYKKGRLDDAMIYYDKALQFNPHLDEAYCNMGNVLKEKGHADKAIANYQKALQINPDIADAYNNIGTILQKKGKFDEAMIYYQKALELDPELFDVCYKIGTNYHATGQIDDAIPYYQKALQLHPNFPNAYNNLGAALQKQGKLAEALLYFEKAIQYDPNLSAAYVNLGLVCILKGKYDKAEVCFRQAMAIQPDNIIAYQDLLFTMLYSSRHNAHSIFTEHVNFARLFAEPLSPAINSHPDEKKLNHRLKIGYVSSDFRKHSVAYFIEPVISNHNRKDFEVFCYSTVPIHDDVTTRLQGYADHWRSFVGKTDEEASQLIRKDAIDILVELAGHTSDRILIFARKPAPIQISWIGYPATTGLSTMDYKIVDDYTDPTGMTEQFYTEKLIRMPESFLCYLPEKNSPAVVDLPLLTSGRITFCSFNALSKVSQQVITLWIKILKAAPGSHLIIKAISLADSATRSQLMDLFIREDITPERIELHPLEPLTEGHLGLYNRCDIALDTFPYNGTTTSCEALWMGVPVITLAGDTHASRVGVSLLSTIGMKGLIAHTPEEYVEIAVALARDTKRLQSLRKGLRDKMAHSPLLDADRFTANLETCYHTMWETLNRNRIANGYK